MSQLAGEAPSEEKIVGNCVHSIQSEYSQKAVHIFMSQHLYSGKQRQECHSQENIWKVWTVYGKGRAQIPCCEVGIYSEMKDRINILLPLSMNSEVNILLCFTP